jgi:hypothetical protein
MDQDHELCTKAVHGSTSPRSRVFSANLAKNAYRCFKCQSQGNHLDLWAATTNQSLYLAANDLCEKLQIERPRIPFTQHPPTGEEEPVLEPVTATRPSNGKSASSPPTPIDKSS